MASHGRTTSVTIKFAKPGTQPPVYVAGSFSHPEWNPQEMPYTTKDDGEHEYAKEIPVEEGKQYQYKFRMGSGDWWVLNEEAPTVTDNVGNKNNLLSVPADYLSASEFEQSKRATDINPPPSEDPSIPLEREHQEMNATETKVVGAIADDHKNLTQAPGDIEKEKSLIAIVTNDADEKGPSSGDISKQPTAIRKAIHPIIKTIREDNRNGASTPELADVAAEVADSAALLDRAQPTPPISDEEACRIGYRRKSSTPIAQVARTAAEVADVAAKLDVNDMHIELPRAPMQFEDEDDIDYATTPEEDRVPLFPHECPGPTDKVAGSLADYQRNSTPATPAVPQSAEVMDINDPSLLPFPTDREGVYAQILNLGRQLQPDGSLPGTPPPASPSISSSRSAERFDIPSPRLLGNQSPSLHAISEDHEVDYVSLVTRKHRPSTLRSKSGSDSRRSFCSSDGLENLNPDVKAEAQHIELTKDKEETLPANKRSVNTRVFSTSTDEDEPLVQSSKWHNSPASHEQTLDVTNASGVETREGGSIMEHKRDEFDLDALAINENPKAEIVNKKEAIAPDEIENVSVTPLIGKRNGSSHPAKEFALNHPNIEIDGASSKIGGDNSAKSGGSSLQTSSVPAVLDPSSGGERQLGHGKEPEFPTTNENPKITLQPATPRSSLRTGTDLSEGPAEGGSTSVSTTNGKSDLVSRKVPRTITPSPERPVTPSSIRSSQKDFKSKNFLKAFWRVVFVNWIGGLIMRLCGGGRDSLLVATMLIVGFGSAFYLSSLSLAKDTGV